MSISKQASSVEHTVRIFDDSFDEFIYRYTNEDMPRDELVTATFVYDEDEDTVFTGVVLGYGTSYRESHIGHGPGVFAKRGTPCSGCRWSDSAIFWAEPSVEGEDGSYVVVTRGCSIVPDEEIRSKMVWTTEPGEVLQALYAPKPRRHTPEGARRERDVPSQNEDALLDAASRDERIAYIADLYIDAKESRGGQRAYNGF